METAGTCLKKEREANNISLGEVARITKITGIYLEHIEKNEFDKLPQGPYIKAYLSSYSRAIGCDVDKIINLYESESRKRSQDEAIQPSTATMDGGKHSVDKLKANIRKQISAPLLGNLRPYLNTLTSFVSAKGSSFKVAKKKIEFTYSSKSNNIKTFLNLIGRLKQSGLSATICRWLTDRKTWIYACIALFGLFILFLAGVGFYHLFIYEPESVTVAETETTPDKEKSMLPPGVSRPPVIPAPSVGASKTAPTPEGNVSNNRLSEPAKSDLAASGAKPENETPFSLPGPAGKTDTSSSDGSSTTEHIVLFGNSAEMENAVPSDRHPIKSESSTNSTIVDASLRVLKANICRAIENRMPTGVDRSFSTSDGKIYVWTEIGAKQIPSKIHHVYYFGGKIVTDVSLDVRSTRWRTWSSKTISNPGYRGEWRVDIATSKGDVLRRLYFEVN